MRLVQFSGCGTVIVLIDYDNLRLGRRGLQHLVTRLLDGVGTTWCLGERSMHCRLYGGWFDGERLSKGAERLAHEMHNEFPQRMRVSDGSRVVRMRVTMEFARSLIVDTVSLTHTYRRRSMPTGLMCVDPPFRKCAHPTTCAIDGLAPFVNESMCPHPRCEVTPRNVLRRSEQKLVDSMLVVDLVTLGQTVSELIVLVSSDDDMWPGLRAALLHNARVLHVSARTPPQYQSLTTQGYSRITIRL